MQPHQYILAASIAWLFTLIALPFLFATARRRAFDHGHAIGLAARNTTHRHQMETLNRSLTNVAESHHDELRTHLRTISALRKEVAELEARIMSYTGIAVTRADYDQLLATANTLRLANRTLTALKSEPQAARAGHQAEALDDLAKRIHAQLRATPASASKAEVAA